MADTRTGGQGGAIAPVLRVEGITKQFLATRALDNAQLEVLPGEVHALMGENGAGKSTLMKILGGAFPPDSGTIRLDGEEVQFTGALDAKRRGIVLVHQELSLVPQISVAENIFLGNFPKRSFARVDRRKMIEEANKVLRLLECDFDGATLVESLPIGKRQMVEIARAFSVSPKVVIFDEPTASLSEHDKEILFRAIRDLRGTGVGVVYISHRMEEVFEIADRISVLRDGAYRGTLNAAETDEAEVTRMMIGRNVEHGRSGAARKAGEPVLEVIGLSAPGTFDDVSFTVRAGEIVGMYGLVGAGRTEVAESIFGLRKTSGGEIRLLGQRFNRMSPKEAVAAGIALVPESRKEQGLILGMSCRSNVTLPVLGEVSAWGMLDFGREQSVFDRYSKDLAIKTSGPGLKVMYLSGGNQQKVVIAKWLATNPKLLILDEPTRGIDVGSKAAIHNLIRDLADQGYAILLISSEMSEVLGVSDRVLAMYSGRIVADFDAAHLTEQQLVGAVLGETVEESARPVPPPSVAEPA